MPLRIRLGIFSLCSLIGLALALGGVARPAVVEAVGGVGADLFFLSPDGNGLMQVFSLDRGNSLNQLSNETQDVIAFDVAASNNFVYITSRSIHIQSNIIISGGPLDNPNLSLTDISLSPNAGQAAITALSNAGADPSEGVWLYDFINSSWSLLLNSSRVDPANTLIYTGVTWIASGDRLLLEAQFSPEASGVALYSLNTGRNQVFNLAGTNNAINENGYGRASISLDGAKLILSDVPNSPNGNGYIVEINNYSVIIPLTDDGSLAARYLSHAQPIVGGTAYFIRDFGNNIRTSEVWQLSDTGARVALGSIPHVDIGFDVAWSSDGMGLAYLSDMDDDFEMGALRVYRRVEDFMEEVSLPAGITSARALRWGPLQGVVYENVERIIFTDALFEFLDESGLAYYSVRAQWNQVPSGNGSYQVTVVPDFEGQSTFDVNSTAARFNRLTCGFTYNLSVAAYGADGALGADSPPARLTMPTCDAEVFPVNVDELYPRGGTTLALAPPSGTVSDSAPPPVDAAPIEPPPTGNEGDSSDAGDDSPPIGAGTPAQVLSIAATEPRQEGTLSDGTPTYTLDLSWPAPEQPIRFFLIRIAPPLTDNRDSVVLSISQGGSVPVLERTIQGLGCGQAYRFTVSSIGDDGGTILAQSDPISRTMPACP